MSATIGLHVSDRSIFQLLLEIGSEGVVVILPSDDENEFDLHQELLALDWVFQNAWILPTAEAAGHIYDPELEADFTATITEGAYEYRTFLTEKGQKKQAQLRQLIAQEAEIKRNSTSATDAGANFLMMDSVLNWRSSDAEVQARAKK